MALDLGELVARIRADDTGFDRAMQRDKAAMLAAKQSADDLGRSSDTMSAKLVKAGQAATKAAAGLTAARNAEADAAGRVRVAEQRLTELRANAKTSASQLAAAEERLAKAHRDSTAAQARAAKAASALGDTRRVLDRESRELGEDSARGMLGGFRSAATALSGNIGALFTQGGPIGVAIITALVVLGAAVIGPALAAAIATGTALGLVGLGAFVLKGLPSIRAGFSALKNDIVDTFRDAAAPLEGPLLGAMRSLQDLARDIGPDLHAMFATLGPAIGPLVQGLGDMVREMMPGLRSMMTAAVPMLADLAAWLPELGASLSDIFDSIADAGPGAMRVFIMLLGVVVAVTDQLFEFIEVVSKAAEWFANLPAWVTGPMGMWARSTDAGAEASHRLAKGITDTADAAKAGTPAQRALADAARILGDEHATAADKVKALDAAFTDLAGTQNDVRAGNAAFAEHLQGAFKEAFDGHAVRVDKVTGSLRLNTEAGREQQGVLIRGNELIADSMKKVYERAIETGVGQQGAAALAIASHNSQRASLVRVLTQMTGNKRTAEALAASYLTVPKHLETLFGQPGIVQALANASRLDLQVRRIPGTKDVAIVAQTAAAQKKLRDLGYTVTTLPDGSIGVILTGAGAVESALNRLARNRVSQVTVNYNVNKAQEIGARAGGGEIRGPGTSTSDSIPTLLSDREWVIKAASAQKVGSAALDYINRHGKLPRFAAGGTLGATPAWSGAGTVVAELSPRAEALLRAVAHRPVELRTENKILARAVRSGEREIEYQG